MASTTQSPYKGEIGQDMVVLYEDQQKINLFAKKNSQKNDIIERMREKERVLQNIEDATDELMLLDDEELIPYEMGEVFILLSSVEAQQKLEEYKSELQQEITEFKSQIDEIQELLRVVKLQLYSKFGENINLEAPEI